MALQKLIEEGLARHLSQFDPSGLLL